MGVYSELVTGLQGVEPVLKRAPQVVLPLGNASRKVSESKHSVKIRPGHACSVVEKARELKWIMQCLVHETAMRRLIMHRLLVLIATLQKEREIFRLIRLGDMKARGHLLGGRSDGYRL